MLGIVEFPQWVQRAVEGFGGLFYGEPQRRHFAEYLMGLLISDGPPTAINSNRPPAFRRATIGSFSPFVSSAAGIDKKVILPGFSMMIRPVPDIMQFHISQAFRSIPFTMVQHHVWPTPF